MKRSLFGLVTLAAALVLGSCATDPTKDLQGDPFAINATPTSMVINVGSAETVDLQVVDQQGNPLAANFAFAIGNAAVVSVEQDTSFRPGLGADRLTQRFIITALVPDTTSVTFSSSGGVSRKVGILSNPLNFPAVFTGSPANINGLITFTGAGFKFPPSTRVLLGGNDQLITAISADSNSVTFRAGQLGGGSITVVGLTLASVTSAALTLPSDVGIQVGPAVTQLTGTDAIATAPDALVPSAAGAIAVLTDEGPYAASTDCTNSPGGFPCRIYRIVTSGADFDVSATWSNNADLGIYFTDAAGTDTGHHDCDSLGQGAGGHPEECTVDGLAAGTYYMYVVSFATGYPPPNNVDPADFSVTITSH